MTWGFVASAAITVVGGAISSNQAKKGAKGAANAAAEGSAAEIAERQRQFDLTRADQKPWLDAGVGALGGLNKLAAGDYSGFESSPDYLYAQKMGMQGVDRHLASRGAYRSGGGDADRMTFASGLASQQLAAYRGSLQSLSGLGQSTASGLGALGMGMANQNAYSLGNATNARMSSYGTRADANSQFATGALGAINNGFQQWNTQRGRG